MNHRGSDQPEYDGEGETPELEWLGAHSWWSWVHATSESG
jgi:hypothetical protein